MKSHFLAQKSLNCCQKRRFYSDYLIPYEKTWGNIPILNIFPQKNTKNVQNRYIAPVFFTSICFFDDKVPKTPYYRRKNIYSRGFRFPVERARSCLVWE
jgi:hypothetical protein